jgi:bifunctional non-homologous end joining protein LigD
MDARFKPMLCTAADEIPNDAERYRLEPKFDGWRTVIHIDETGAAHTYGGRNGSDYSGKVPYITDGLRGVLPPGTVIDGELIGANGWGDVQGTMTRGVGPHVPSAAAPALTLVAFDVLLLNGQDIRQLEWQNRRSLLELIPWPEHTFLTPSGEATAEAHVRMLDMGMEGSVVKRIDSRYSSGSRSPLWRKLKAIASEDGEIVGFEPGEGKYAGMVGAIKVQYVAITSDGSGRSVHQTTASGMTDAVRKDMTDNPFDYVGKMVEIAHNGILPSGKLRHPRFKRMRDDRSPAPETAKDEALAALRSGPKVRKARAPRSGPWMRNYGAMGDAKLQTCLRELAFKNGDAYQRVLDKGGDLEQHRRVAREAALAKGLSVPAFNTP